MKHGYINALPRLLATIATTVLIAHLSPAAARPPLTISPGQATRMHWPPVDTEIEVYIPSDYTPDRRWPIVFHYHGLNGTPSTTLLQNLTGGAGCIVVGMEYLERGLAKRTAEENDTYHRREMKQLLELQSVLEDELKIDTDKIFISGTSKGGWQVSALLERGVPRIDGAMILIAGRFPRRCPSPKLDDIPLYIGAGENDPNNPYTRMAAEYFQRCGAQVTYEEYAGKGHAVDTDADGLHGWVDVYLCPDREAARERAQAWLRASRDRFGAEKNEIDRYWVLADIAENPWLSLCGRKSKSGVLRQLDSLREDPKIMAEYKAQELYEKALWQEQSASSLRDLERSLNTFEKTIERFGKTRYGHLAERDAERVQGFVDEAHARLRTRAPQLPRIRVK